MRTASELWRAVLSVGLVSLSCVGAQAVTPEELFKTGVEAYRGEKYTAAAENFHLAAAIQPSSGTLQNAGNADWK
jgi:hypothetical protein